MKRLIGLFGLLIFLFSCTHTSKPQNVLDEAAMKAVLADMHLADAYLYSVSDTDSVAKMASGYYQTIFKNHQTNLKTFERSLRWYAERPQVLDKMYAEIRAEWDQANKPRNKSSKSNLKDSSDKRSLPEEVH